MTKRVRGREEVVNFWLAFEHFIALKKKNSSNYLLRFSTSTKIKIQKFGTFGWFFVHGIGTTLQKII